MESDLGVGTAGRNIYAAAQTMNRAATTIDEALAAHIKFLSDLSEKLEVMVARLEALAEVRNAK